MIVGLTDLGSIWRTKFGKDSESGSRFATVAFYNTTGVVVEGKARPRPKIPGYIRFDVAGGFTPNYPRGMVNKVFECDPPCVWQGENKLRFKRVIHPSCKPDRFLVVVRSKLAGTIAVGDCSWRSPGSLLISFSECEEQQETMLLLPIKGWIRSQLGTFVLEPLKDGAHIARLVLSNSTEERHEQ